MTLPLPGMETVAEARERVMRERWEQDGIICPCCDQRAKVYPRSIYATMARQLITAWRHVRTLDDPFAYFHLPSVIGATGDPAKARYWGLIEAMPDVTREDGGKAGWWRFTELGARWVTGVAAVPRRALTYNKAALRVEGPAWTIRDALGKAFDLQELMGPAGTPPGEDD